MTGKLHDKRIIVTGASDGIGQRIAIDAAKEGARIAFCGLPEHDPAETAEAIRATGSEPFFMPLDVRDHEEARRFVRESVAFLGGLDGLVNNAGKNRYAGVEKATAEDIDWDLAVNFEGAWAISQEAYPALKENGGGMIVFTSSINSRSTYPGFFPYNMAKAALDALIVSIALEWGRDGIQAVGIAPAMVHTPHADKAWASLTESERQEKIEKINSFYPVNRMCETSDISSLAVYLLSGVNRFITGQTIVLDGGLSAHSGERW